jgi:aminoglycoside/choline kinase family phosphotransferase
MDVLKTLFETHFRAPVERVKPLQGQLGGSGRSILRISGSGFSAIGVIHRAREENVAFIEFSRHFRRHGLPVPEIYAHDLGRDAYIEEDLGDTTLFEFLSKQRAGDEVSPQAVEAYQKVVATLPRFQVEAGRTLNYRLCHPRASFDRQSITWDLNYFKYYYLRLAGIPFDEQDIEDDFGRLTKFLLTAERDYFMYRDFQSRNIMWRYGHPFFIDYQGGRKGALQYDVASLLYDAKADLPPALRLQLLDRYLEALSAFAPIKRETFMQHFYAYVYVRIMQAMGAYGFRGFYERKAHFLQSVPYALNNLRWLLQNVELPVPLPALTEAFRRMTEAEPAKPASSVSEQLTVRVFSFSYRQGLPKDDSGNGGGFVFDSRALPNPGREEQFKSLTGRDSAVIAYLDRHDSVHQFLANAMTLVEPSIANYQSRGFQNLMISFGCTGGRHRSVFLAEQLAERLRAKGGVQVVVRHLGLENMVS